MNEFDVIIIGAGLSGVGTACHLERNCPGTSYVLLESRSDLGGTWDLFKYPGLRSDSDMASMSYKFKAWKSTNITAQGKEIKNYIGEAASEYGVSSKIRYNHKVERINWSSQAGRWFITVNIDGQLQVLTSKIIDFCGGYYSYEKGYTPEFKGLENYKGKLIHSQKWPEDYDYSGKSMVVIGSGATAITLVPSLAEKAKHITMLQRSPSYIMSMPNTDYIAKFVGLFLPLNLRNKVVRWKNIKLVKYIYSKCRRQPEKMRKFFIGTVKRAVGKHIDVEKHFTPKYNPWDQRLCLAVGGDLFKAIKKGKVGVVTDHISEFTEEGLLLKSGQRLQADTVVLATGLNLTPLGGISMSIDDKPLNIGDKTTFMGVMLEGVPNFVITFGYVNATWTLRSDIIGEYLCKIVNHMNQSGQNIATPTLKDNEVNMKRRPFVESFSSGYLQRTTHLFPRQGEHWPWINCQDYEFEKENILKAPLDLEYLKFSNINEFQTKNPPGKFDPSSEIFSS